jgi:hypothetical protein
MCYPDREDYITLLFQFLEEFEASDTCNPTERRGHPQVYPDSSLIVFFAIMLLKAVNRFKAQHRWLLVNPDWLPRLNLETVPSRVTLSRRYKQVAPKLEAFIAYLGDVGISLDTETPPEVIYQDKSLYKAKGSVWHQKDRNANIIPDGLRNLDTDASWSTSKYRGWVYGYGLHLTTTASGFPRLAAVYTGSVSEKAGLDHKTDALLERNIRYITADAGYTDLNRVKQLASQGVLLLTPVVGAKSDTALDYLQAIETSETLSQYQKQRKTAIEPVFAVLLELGAIHSNQKQLPIQRLDNVRPFLLLTVILLQLAMIVNSIWRLPVRNVSMMMASLR